MWALLFLRFLSGQLAGDNFEESELIQALIEQDAGFSVILHRVTEVSPGMVCPERASFLRARIDGMIEAYDNGNKRSS